MRFAYLTSCMVAVEAISSKGPAQIQAKRETTIQLRNGEMHQVKAKSRLQIRNQDNVVQTLLKTSSQQENADCVESHLDNYDLEPNTCVNGQNIDYLDDYSREQCAEDCDARDDCQGIDYIYSSGQCRPQSSDNTAGCDGAYWNSDFYRPKATMLPLCPECVDSALDNYDLEPDTCVNGQNIDYLDDYSREQCAEDCDDREDCMGIDYIYSSGQCRPQSSDNTAGCDGAYWTSDFYRPKDTMLPLCEVEKCVDSALDNYSLETDTCVNGQNIAYLDDYSREQCAEDCDDREDCMGIDYIYSSGQCRPQSSDNTAGCDGAYWTSDFYRPNADKLPLCEQPAEDCVDSHLDNYSLETDTCVNGQNIAYLDDYSREQCAEDCDAREDCEGIDYIYSSGQCRPQSSDNTAGCDGAYWTSDFYRPNAVILPLC